MVAGSLQGVASRAEQKAVTELLRTSQAYVRRVVADASATSLRDVKRALTLMTWFAEHIVYKEAKVQRQYGYQSAKKKREVSEFASPMVLGLAFTYYFRLSDAAERAGYWDALRFDSQISFSLDWSSDGLRAIGWNRMRTHGWFEKTLSSIQVCAY